MEEQHSHWNLLQGYLPLANELIMVVLFSSMSAVIKTRGHKQSSPYHYQEHESWPSKRRQETGNTKAWYELCQKERQAAFEQQVNHTFFSIMFPWKDQICIWSTTTLNLQGEKSILCAESSLGESCSSNYRHCLPKPSAVAFITPGRAAAELGGEEETQASQQPQPGCTGKLRHWCDPKRTDVLVIHTSLSCRCSWCSPSRGNRGTHILFRSKEIRRPSSSQTKQAQWEVSGQNLIPQMRKFVLWSQSEQPNFHSPHTSPPRGDANDMARIIEKELNPSLTSTCRLHPDLHTFMLMTPASADCFHQHRYR